MDLRRVGGVPVVGPEDAVAFEEDAEFPEGGGVLFAPAQARAVEALANDDFQVDSIAPEPISQLTAKHVGTSERCRLPQS